MCARVRNCVILLYGYCNIMLNIQFKVIMCDGAESPSLGSPERKHPRAPLRHSWKSAQRTSGSQSSLGRVAATNRCLEYSDSII